MSQKELSEMLLYASNFCEKHFAARGEIAPMWHVITSDGKTLIELHPCQLGKEMAAAMIRSWFDLVDAVRYVYIGEAWTLNRLFSEEEKEEIFRKGIAEHPDRVEVVQLQGEDRDYGQIIMSREIIRPKGRKPYLGPLQDVNDLPHIPAGANVTSEGRMVGMLPVRGTRQ